METTQDTMMPTHLPSFENPPIVEALLSVQFDVLPKLSNGHLGAFWKTLGAGWSSLSDVPRLEPQIEKFEDPAIWRQTFQWRIGQDAGSRLQIRNDDPSRMIQVQNGRFIYNWTIRNDKGYPRYAEIRPAFDVAWRGFIEFLNGESLGTIIPNQWEVTYVNRIAKGTVWKTSMDWPALFPGLLGPSNSLRIPGIVESFGGEWHFELPPKRGRLHIQLMHSVDPEEDTNEIMALTLTARGPIKDDCNLSLGEGFDLGHATIVRTFAAITSADAHKYWRRTT